MANKQTTGQLLDALDKIALRVASIQSIMAADPGASTHKHAVTTPARFTNSQLLLWFAVDFQLL